MTTAPEQDNTTSPHMNESKSDATIAPSVANPQVITSTGDDSKSDMSLKKLVENSRHVMEMNKEQSMTIKQLNEEKLEMQRMLENFLEANNGKINEQCDSSLKPWVDALQISPEDKVMFLDAMKEVMKKAQTKGMPDFEKNPVWNVACAAAASHGALVAENERLLNISKTLSETEVTRSNVELSRMSKETLMHIPAAEAISERASSKRPFAEISRDDTEMNTSKCWGDVFSQMATRRM